MGEQKTPAASEQRGEAGALKIAAFEGLPEQQLEGRRKLEAFQEKVFPEG